MFKFKILMVKINSVKLQNNVTEFAEQTVISDDIHFNYKILQGYAVVSVTRILDEVIITKNEAN